MSKLNEMLVKVRATVRTMSARMDLSPLPDEKLYKHEAEKSLHDAVEAVRDRSNDKECLAELVQAFELFNMCVLIFDPDDTAGTLNRMLLIKQIDVVTEHLKLKVTDDGGKHTKQ